MEINNQPHSYPFSNNTTACSFTSKGYTAKALPATSERRYFFKCQRILYQYIIRLYKVNRKVFLNKNKIKIAYK